MPELSRLAIHTTTNRPWSLAECIDAYQRAGVGGISVWPQSYESIGIERARALLEASSLEVASLVGGGFFVAPDRAVRREAIERTRSMIIDAATIGARMLVIVAGANPQVRQDEAREQVTEGLEAVVATAESYAVNLALEPLHPMYADDRSCICTLRDAAFICDRVDHERLGLAVDAYHVWWDPELDAQIASAGRRRRLFGFHIADWRPPRDLLNDRALMGEGCIDVRRLREIMERAGFDGMIEVEISSEASWAQDQQAFLSRICEAFRACC